jgi:hypothetical protein
VSVWNSDLPVTQVGANRPTVVYGDGLTDYEDAALARLWRTWCVKYERNRLRQDYYEGHVKVRNLKLAFKDESIARQIKPRCGWPAKAVDMLAERSVFDYFVFTSEDGFADLREAYEQNGWRELNALMTTSEITHSCAFYTVSAGDPDAGEPNVVISGYSALNAAAVWDRRHKCIAYGMAITDTDDDGKPTALNLYTRDAVVEMVDLGNGEWHSERHAHSMGRPLMEPIVYKASLDRPMGRSRITRSVMSITDNALREVMRTEIAGEIYTVPQRYFLNVDFSSLGENNFKTYWNSYFAVNAPDGSGTPSAGQFNPPGMNDHIVYMRSLAAQFAGETGLPISALGVVSDNPSSAEAISEARTELVKDAERLNRANGAHLLNVARLVVATSRGLTFAEAAELMQGTSTRFKPADMPSRAVIADATLKEVQAIPQLAETKSVLSLLGHPDDEVEAIWAELGQVKGLELAEKLAEGLGQTTPPTFSASDEGTTDEPEQSATE